MHFFFAWTLSDVFIQCRTPAVRLSGFHSPKATCIAVTRKLVSLGSQHNIRQSAVPFKRKDKQKRFHVRCHDAFANTVDTRSSSIFKIKTTTLKLLRTGHTNAGISRWTHNYWSAIMLAINRDAEVAFRAVVLCLGLVIITEFRYGNHCNERHDKMDKR